jgi:23S rRNA (cytidine1920-2'-O)/16S rRNA (cytidine1409-2'-O)-methyltransferase
LSTERLDRAIVSRGLVDTRTKAQRLIVAGNVLINGLVATKPSVPVGERDHVELREHDLDVGRGAKKLRHALVHWAIPVRGRVCADLGASTGGFSQVLLEAEASSVVAIDVGHSQLHEKVARDPRIWNIEGQSVLDLSAEWWESMSFPGPVGLVVADLSFVSLQKVIPVAVDTFGVHSDYVFLVKPQFEVGKGRTSHGVVKDIPRRDQSVRDVAAVFRASGVDVRGVIVSPITGERGNVEYLMLASSDSQRYPAEWDGRIPPSEQETTS